jgi:hypothetical protein
MLLVKKADIADGILIHENWGNEDIGDQYG